MSLPVKAPFTGRHMAAIMVAFFGVVIVVNVMMARFAISTFGGEVVENSYVASQHFNRWLDEAKQEGALGWKAVASHRSDNRVQVALSGTPVGAVQVTAIARHVLGRLPDQTMTFSQNADGTYISAQTLPPERWRLRIAVNAGGKNWHSEEDIR